MNTDSHEPTFFVTAARAYVVNFWTALGVATLLILVEWLTLVFNNAFAKYIAPVMLVAYFAYAIHATILYGFTSGMSALKDDKNSQKFMWRSVMFFGMFAIIALALSFVGFGIGGTGEIGIGWAFIMVIIIGVPVFGAVLVLWGTMLPATVAGEDASFKASWQRANGHFWYAYLRLAIGPFLLGTALTAAGIGAIIAGLPVDIIDKNGQFAPLGALSTLVINMANLFITALTASILCKTYLRGQSTAPAP